MNIVQALKARKRLVAQLQKVRTDIRDGNRVIVGNPRDVIVGEAMEREQIIFNKMVELRAAIAVANGPIWGHLLRMAEIKERIGFLRGIPTNAGKAVGRRSFMSDESPDVEWEVTLTKREIDEGISSLELELANLQDEVDRFNAQTEVAVDVSNELLF